MNLAKYTKSACKNCVYTLTMNNPKRKLLNSLIYNSIKNNNIPTNKLNQGGKKTYKLENCNMLL